MQQLHLSQSVWVENLDPRHLKFIIVNIHYPMIEWDIHNFRGRKVEGVYCKRPMPTMWLPRWDKETGEEVKRNRF